MLQSTGQGTVNTWRHDRMRRLIAPLLESCIGSTWLTVGDGRYGLDAQFLEQHGARAVASDICDTLLIQAQKEGLISAYSKENAESLSYPDGSFDFVYCKESYHHFPRPYLALYEMMRVARVGAVLVEPQDFQIPRGIVQSLFRLAKDGINRVLGRGNEGHDFEKIGNYMYKVSYREIEKFALGCGYSVVAFKGINDFYFAGLEQVSLEAESQEFKRVRRKIEYYDFLCRLGINQHGLLCVVIFKESPSSDCLSKLKSEGFLVVELPPNPWLNR